MKKEYFGTDGRVYGGDSRLVHIADGKRVMAGEAIADFIDSQMRQAAFLAGKNSLGALCPGCYMIALFNASLTLAQRNGQSLTELGNTMAQAYSMLARDPSKAFTEEINVCLDDDARPDAELSSELLTAKDLAA